MKGLLTLAAMLTALPATASTITCADRAAVTAKLSELGEIQTGVGLNSKGQAMEIWTSEASGAWTIVLTTTAGRACIMAYGHHWSGLSPVAGEKPGKSG